MTAPALKPFLLLSTRREDDAARAEYVSFRDKMGLTTDEIIQVRVDERPLGPVRLEDYSGILLGGSPFNNSDKDKSDLQLRVERDVSAVVSEALEKDFPLFGACYGIGAVGTALGAVVDTTYGEKASVIQVELTAAGRRDPLLAGMPTTFATMVGHKEAISWLPEHAEVLVTGENCPVQMFRVGANVYATQFHPELDPEAFEYRLRIYEHAGYYGPGELENIIALTRNVDLSVDDLLLRNFARKYQRPN